MAAERILVIKLGAMGDWVLATGPFAAIRAHHRDAEITLLTLPEFAGWGGRCGWFDRVWTDDRPGWLRPGAWLALGRRLARAGFARVYDLQTSDRSSLCFRLWPRPRPEWSGIARGCSHPHANPRRDLMHTVERQAEQLAMAGIAQVPPPSLDWLDGDLAGLDVPARAALLVPGGSAHRPGKRWPADSYAALARGLGARGVTPLLIGAGPEAEVLARIAAAAPGARDLGGRLGLDQLAALARRAEVAVGNDTGPMHVIATAGCPSVVLFSGDSDPALCAPRGPRVRVLRRQPLAELGVAEVAEVALATARGSA
ncbi:MAG TPA: glycosyltransferase family 9 protein [Alphaproteobacteria bacterium]